MPSADFFGAFEDRDRRDRDGGAPADRDARASGGRSGDAALRSILTQARRIAVLGIKAGALDDAYQVPAYLQAQGYEILGVNPKLQRVLGEPCVPRLADLRQPVDLVNVFRASRHIAAHVEEILALAQRPRAAWLQLGIRDDASAARLEAEGLRVVQDRCILVEHRRLLGRA